MRTCILGAFAVMLLVLGPRDLNCTQRRQLAISVQEGINVPTGGQFLSMANGSSAREVLLWFPGIEIRYTHMPGNLFVFASYGGAVASTAANGRLGLSLRTNMAGFGLGKSFSVGRGAFAPRLGFSYSSRKYEMQYDGETHPSIYNNGFGLIVGGQISAPMTDSIELLIGYEFQLRSSMNYSARFPRGGAFTLDQNGRDNFFFLGITYWAL